MNETKKVYLKFAKNDSDTKNKVVELCSEYEILWRDDEMVTRESLDNVISFYGEIYLCLSISDGDITLTYDSMGYQRLSGYVKKASSVYDFFKLAIKYRNEQKGICQEENDVKNQPHYKNNSIEPIEYMRKNFTTKEYRGFLQGNVHKYMARYKDKNGLEDLKKAKVYLEWLIEDVALNGLELDKEPKGML